MEKFGKFTFGFVYLVIGIAFAAFVLSILWSWFIVPLGVPAISIAHAFGLQVLVAFFKVNRKVKDKKEPRKENYFGYFCELASICILISLTALGLGWVAVSLM